MRLRRADGSPIGVYSGIGTFAERQVVAEAAAIAVDPRTPPEIAALVGCAVTTGVGAVMNTARVEAASSVVVIGAGGVGLSVVMAAAAAGAHPVVAIDAVAAKRELAMRAGATHVMAPEDARDELAAIVAGGADHVFEAIGLTETVEWRRPDPAGRDDDPRGHDSDGRPGRHRRLSVRRGWQATAGLELRLGGPGRDFPAICARFLGGELPLEMLVTERIGLDDLPAAFEAMRRRDEPGGW